MPRIFISHATADKELLKPFVELLRIGLNLKEEDIFCTSIEGMGIPRGKNFVQFIKERFQVAEFVVMVITPAYYESAFCLCELGAVWISKEDTAMPFLVPPLGYEDLKAVLTPKQAGFINSDVALNELRDRLHDARIASGASTTWEAARDTFIKKFAKLKDKLSGRTNVPATELNEIKEKYEAVQDKLVEKDEEIERLQEWVKRLEAAKDREEVRDIRSEYTDEEEQFDSLVEKFCKAAARIPRVGVEVLFHENKGGTYRLKDRFVYGNEWEEAEEARDDGYVVMDGNRVDRNETNPKMSAALEALNEVRTFMENVAPEFEEARVQENETQFSLGSREFWKKVFNL